MSPAAILWVIRICATLILLSAIVVPSCRYGYSRGAAQATEKLQAHLAADAVLAIAASEDARKAEQAHALALADVAQQYEQDKQDAQATHDRIVAGLKSGTVRLQDHWTCPSGVPPVGTGTRIADEIARLQQESAGRIVEAVAECEAQVRGLQAVTVKDRQ